MRRSVLCLLLAALFLLPSCAPSDGFDAGRPITPEELASLSAELFTAATEPAEEERETVLRDPNRVYWVKGGSVYHFDPDCPHLKNAKNVIEGTFRTAAWSYGIEKACSSCDGD